MFHSGGVRTSNLVVLKSLDKQTHVKPIINIMIILKVFVPAPPFVDHCRRSTFHVTYTYATWV